MPDTIRYVFLADGEFVTDDVCQETAERLA